MIMTTLRRDAYSLLDRMPEEKLAIVIRFMRDMDEQIRLEDMQARRAAFARLESMIKPVPGLNEKKELASWREEKFGAGTDRATKDRVPGTAKGKFVCPDTLDEGDELIADWFEGKKCDGRP